MDIRTTALERAFILAISGRWDTVAQIRGALKDEGCADDGQILRTVAKQLTKPNLASKAQPR
jgi:glycine cleavage system regulatory protein